MVSKCCRNAPVADIIAASELRGAFVGKNIAATLDRVLERHEQASSDAFVGTMTDGAHTDKESESRILLRMQGQYAFSSSFLPVYLARKETCAITTGSQLLRFSIDPERALSPM
eukprot:6191578-Pleurochrysis_carterae.AAC.2